MSKAAFTGKPVAKPGSPRYRPLPAWVLDELDKPAGGKARRLRDPQGGRGLTVHEAAAALGYAPFSMYMLMQGTQGTWRTKDVGVRELGGATLNVWDEYSLEPDGRLLRLLICSAEQIERIRTVRQTRTKALQTTAWLTDEGVMRRYPDLFAQRAVRVLKKTVAKMTDRELQRYRPTCLTNWRNKDVGCTYLPGGRHLNNRHEAGRILNDPDDIDAIAAAMLRSQENEWTDPQSKTVYIPTRVVAVDYQISEQVLTSWSKHPTRFLPGDGMFHPIYRKNGKSNERWWPKVEVEAFVKGWATLRNRVADAKAFIGRLIARAPVKAGDGVKALKDTGFPNWALRKALAELKAEDKLVVTRTGSNAWFWHKPEKPRPARKTKSEQAKDYLVELLSRGAAYRSDVLARARKDGYGHWLIYPAFKEAGGLSKLIGKPGTPEQRRLWYLEGTDTSKVQQSPHGIPSADSEALKEGDASSEKCPGHTKKPHRTGPRPDPRTEEVYEFCYDEYIRNRKSRKTVLFAAQKRFPGKAPKSQRAVGTYAERWANRFEPPLPLGR